MKKLWLSATLVAALSACTSMPPAASQAGGPIKKPEMDRIAAAPAAMATAASGGFSQFLALSAQMQPNWRPPSRRTSAKATLRGDDLVNISRLLGLYNRLKNQAAVIDATARMVSIPTVRSDKVPPHEDKHIIAFGALVEGMAKGVWSAIPQRGQPRFEVKLPGSGP